MRWIIVCVLLTISVPAWAAKKKNRVVQPQPEPQQTQQMQPTESNLWNQKICPQEIEDLKILLTFNPYDSEGRCFNYVGRLVQLLNKNQALFSFLTAASPFSLIDFGKGSVPMGPFYGVVKGKGAFSYETASGSQNIIFSFVSVPKSKEREAWEKKKAVEKTNEEEIQRAEKRAKVEQKWKQKIENSKNTELIIEPFIYTDPSTGLMWARNGNIPEAGLGMGIEWKDAMEWVKKLEYAGYNDWRLPTKEEFDSFVRTNHIKNKYPNYDAFFNVQIGSSDYLTSSRYKEDRDICWSFCLMSGEWGAMGPISRGFVWPVRGGNVSSE